MSTLTKSLPGVTSLQRWGAGRPWLGSCVAAVLAWAATVFAGQGQGSGDLLTAALTFSAFTVLVSLGQMLVISVGPGNADLSIPSSIALSGAVAMIVMNGDNTMIVPGILAAVLVGATVGAFNFGLIRVLNIPPIIATLAGSLIVMSVAINIGRGLKIKPPPLFSDFMAMRLLGVPLLAMVALVVTVGIAVMLERTVLGRSIAAVGQNDRAARLAGLKVEVTRFWAYVICAGLAGLTGALISGFAGGNSLDQGQEYLLLTIAVVVIGGTAVSGGAPSVPGIWGAAMFMFLLVAMLNAAGAGPGLRTLLTGLIIIAVIVAASSPGKR
ncbi:MAG: ABC transporter permease [Rhodoferax sp.]|uniref:ABC transporter permease n=1 Tax=Rhodoferax sp. TaxID=50421 RepID=UPI0027226819|nr:ABC transporter permease [Rhodoferax sp.]MDO9143775.1 ABC transporter permease [Rhodoferax sp.]MDP1531021.1 ABC transporter permease [Rhodoferax sp.]MDP1945038.1 ABC transporter permease [Rhodoferax sp.]MDP3193088.1 ABC transporter permease [Rhodoferax sp.]MDP3335494.1 ABC transporter permease [Rhodoferax sp.]